MSGFRCTQRSGTSRLRFPSSFCPGTPPIRYEALVLLPAHSPSRLVLKDFTELVMRANDGTCIRSSYVSALNFPRVHLSTLKHTWRRRISTDCFDSSKHLSDSGSSHIRGPLNALGTRKPHGEGKTASLEWRPLRVGGDSAGGPFPHPREYRRLIAAIAYYGFKGHNTRWWVEADASTHHFKRRSP